LKPSFSATLALVLSPGLTVSDARRRNWSKKFSKEAGRLKELSGAVMEIQ